MLATQDATPSGSADRRREPRCPLDAPYTEVRVKRADAAAVLHGHAYDLSARGLRFEVDAPLTVGEAIAVELTLPGPQQTHIHGEGRVVRRHDADEVGPLRFGLMFTHVNRDQIDQYLADRK